MSKARLGDPVTFYRVGGEPNRYEQWEILSLAGVPVRSYGNKPDAIAAARRMNEDSTRRTGRRHAAS